MKKFLTIQQFNSTNEVKNSYTKLNQNINSRFLRDQKWDIKKIILKTKDFYLQLIDI